MMFWPTIITNRLTIEKKRGELKQTELKTSFYSIKQQWPLAIDYDLIKLFWCLFKWILSSHFNVMKQCRICLSSSSNNEIGHLITPCKCRGIFAYVHDKCVSKWVEDYDCNYCDICRFKYIMIRRSKNFYQWIREDKDEIIEMTLILIGTIFALYLIFISFTILFHSLSKETYDTILHWTNWYPVVFVFTDFIDAYSSIILLTSTLVWAGSYSLLIYKLLSKKISHFKDWRRTHFRIQVLNCDREVEPHTVPRCVQRSSGLRRGILF